MQDRIIGHFGASIETKTLAAEELPPYIEHAAQMLVNCLVSGGKTDREIGEELFISIKTVGNHVGNILTKTNAATFANQHGLVTPDDEEE